MIPIEDMPDCRADLAKFDVQFPELDKLETARHPSFVDALVDYLVLEGEDVFEEDLSFLRSALVEATKFWIWEFVDNADERHFATVSEAPDGQQTHGYDRAEGLTPEQAILATYHDCY
jgi:hypothetical protein